MCKVLHKNRVSDITKRRIFERRLRKGMVISMDKKHIIITGASRGIGRSIAMHYAQKGWNVSVCSRHNPEKLAQLKQSLEELGGGCFTFTGDMGNPEDAAAYIDEAVRAFGTPDILVNNAGISHVGLLQDMTTEEWDEILRTNLSSCFYTCRAIIPHLLEKKQGCIINISSVWGNVGASTEVAYSATKGGINAFTKALAKELAPSGIPVNAIACGIIDTEMNQFLSAEEKGAILEEIPSGRMGTPDEAALLVERIAASPSYLTGQIITMDGGWI
jgi:3-oxoacyl-[acyl-carrier protein] reductase